MRGPRAVGVGQPLLRGVEVPARVGQGSEGGQGRPDALIVGDDAVVEGHIEIRTDDGRASSKAVEIDVRECLFVHCGGKIFPRSST